MLDELLHVKRYFEHSIFSNDRLFFGHILSKVKYSRPYSKYDRKIISHLKKIMCFGYIEPNVNEFVDSHVQGIKNLRDQLFDKASM